MKINQTNIDPKVVEDFGKEWEKFNQNSLSESDLKFAFNQYFNIFPFEKINRNSEGFDMGCGSGRWAKLIAPKVGRLNCIDPSSVALKQAKLNLEKFDNCYFECASVSNSEIIESSQDFGYCLGVLHHIPNTLEGLKACSRKLKSGAPFLIYLYYRFDNKPLWYKALWKISDFVRQFVSLLPFKLKLVISQILAFLLYYPLARIAFILEKLGLDVSNMPLSDYRNKPLYSLKTDSLDRFGTKLEKRFTKVEIEKMLIEAGFINIKFSSVTPYWVAVAEKN
jgi:ubiquinone/menaquinone biosynthesis C-methylase UbiE